MKKYLRFHLITLIVVQLAAAGLLWVNFQQRGDSGWIHYESRREDFVVYSQGWPYEYYQTYRIELLSKSAFVNWRYGALAKDAGLALLIVFASGVASEFLLRRRNTKAAP